MAETGTTRQVVLPQLGESVDHGTIVAWLVRPGDEIAVEQPIAEVSTDKVDTEIPSPAAGRVVRLLVEVDAEVAVGAPIAELATSDGAGHDEAGEGQRSAPRPSSRLSPRVRRLLEQHGLTAADVPATGDRITPEDVERAAAARTAGATGGTWRGLRLSPLVRRLLRDHDLDPHELRGSGPRGRLTPDDVRAAATATPAGSSTAAPTVAVSTATRTAGTPTAAPSASSDDGRQRVEPLSRTRRVIADRMLTSLQTTAQLTAAVEADVSRIMHLRARTRDVARERFGTAPSPLAFIAKATCRVLQRHPVINASIDTDAGTVTYHRPVNLGIAVDTPAGLVVPVVHAAHELGVPALQARIDDLADRARSRDLQPDDVHGGTFTITNTGAAGTLFDTPILNPPEAAILATPRIEKRPVVIEDRFGNDRVAIRHRTYLCLSYDHRLIDGADAGRFLTDLVHELDTTDWEQELAELGATATAPR